MNVENVFPPKMHDNNPAEFLDVIGTKVLRVVLLAIHSHLWSSTNGIPLPPPP
jgi:hypothetical protein